MAIMSKRIAHVKDLRPGDRFTMAKADKIIKTAIGCIGPYAYYFPVCNPSIAGSMELASTKRIYIDDG